MLRPLFVVLGFTILGLGLIVIFVPGLPTTPLVLLAAYFFSRSSERFHQWLLNNRIFGKYIRDYQENPSIKLRTKIISQLMMWTMILYATVFLIEYNPAKISVILLGFVGSWYVLIRIPTRKK
jgi:hypothetical protein